jgi:uncharacterized protein YheU (UPF0270 family)
VNDDDRSETPESAAPVEVPHGELAPETLRAVIESFVLREGTDYGERDVSFDSKVADVRRQLDRREAVIVYDPVSDSIDIVVRRPVSSGSPSRD